MSRQTIGPFSEDEIPVSPLQYRFDGVDLTSFVGEDAHFDVVNKTTRETMVWDAVIDTPTNAADGDSITHFWDDDDLKAGVHVAEPVIPGGPKGERFVFYVHPRLIEAEAS